MVRRAWCVCLPLLLASAGTAAAQTVDEVITRSFEAQGGAAKMKAVQSVRMTGRMSGGPGGEVPLTIEMRRPKSMRVDLTVQGAVVSQGFDGMDAWLLNPLSGRPTAILLPAEQVKAAEEQADMDGPLMDYAAKGHKAELAGRETVGGAECFVVRVTESDGDVTTFYIDATTYLSVRQDRRRTVQGRPVEIETVSSDWKKVDGLLFPHVIETGPKGSPQKQRLTLDAIELNVVLDDARFKMPR